MVAQFPWIERVAAAYGATVVKRDGVEADDLLATFASRAASQGFDVYLVTADKDFAQLVGPRVKMLILSKPDSPAQVLDEKGVEAKFGVPPERIVDYLALMGDASDNVPGIRGVGEKTAADLVKRFGTAEEVLTRAKEIEREKLREAVLRDAEHVRLAKKLVTLDTDVPDLPAVADLPAHAPDVKALRAIFEELDFNNLLQTLPSEPTGKSETGRRYHLVRDAEAFEAMLVKLSKAKKLAVDTETTGIDAMACQAVGVSLCAEPLEAYYVPLLAEPPVLAGGAREIAERLKPLLEDPKIVKIGQNAKYDLLVLGNLGIDVKPVVFDTMVASFCVAPTGRQHNLDALALRYLDVRKIATDELIGKGKSQITMDQVPVDKVAEYACEDADCTFRIEPFLRKELDEAGTRKLFEDLEMPLVPVLTDIERRGVKIDGAMLGQLSTAMTRERDRLESEIHALAGTPFQIGSTKELGVILFERMRLHEAVGRRSARKTKTGYSTDADVLEELAEVAPIAAKVLEYRQVTKLQNTYLDTLPTLVNPKTGRIHTTLRQTVAATGRLSSDNPNLQNIPIRTPLGREIRKAFVPEKGFTLVSADYSQIELRLVAHFSGDPVLKEAFDKGEDIHRRTAAVVFGVMPELVGSELRSRAKAINFGIIYGMGPQRLARETGMTVPEAKKFIDAYFERLPKVRRFLDDTLDKAEKSGFAVTLAGRKRAIPELLSDDPRVRANAENIAVNTPIQGSAADVIKLAMIDLDKRLRAAGIDGGMILQVHDELVLEVPSAQAEAAADLTRTSMEGAVRLSVPLHVDLGMGANWLEAHG
jgi:DNA polymerase-1